MTAQPKTPWLVRALIGVASIAALVFLLFRVWGMLGRLTGAPTPRTLIEAAAYAGACLGWGWLAGSNSTRGGLGRRDLTIIVTIGVLGTLLTLLAIPVRYRGFYLLLASTAFAGLWILNGLGGLWIWKTVRRIRQESNRED